LADERLRLERRKGLSDEGPSAFVIREGQDVWMPLCPVCFNAAAYCECDPPYEPSIEELHRHEDRPTTRAQRETEERLLEDVSPDQRALLRQILAGFLHEGAWLETPPAEVPNYVNVRVPARFGQARLCAITRSTGRIEFHDESYPVASQLGLGERFDQLPAGDKAAITASDEADVEAILTLARAVLASRRGTG